MKLSFYQVSLASGKSVVVEAFSEVDAKAGAFEEYGLDPLEEVVTIALVPVHEQG